MLTSDVSRYLTGNSGRPDRSFEALLPEMAARLGWECVCRTRTSVPPSAMLAYAWRRQGCFGCQLDDWGKRLSHVLRKPA